MVHTYGRTALLNCYRDILSMTVEGIAYIMIPICCDQIVNAFLMLQCL